MQYALLFYQVGQPLNGRTPSEREAWFAEMRAWREELERAGVFRTALRLASPTSASSLRKNGAEILVTDGPFAETKEFLGGFVAIDCENLDAALAWGRRCPITRIGTIEVRPEFTSQTG